MVVPGVQLLAGPCQLMALGDACGALNLLSEAVLQEIISESSSNSDFLVWHGDHVFLPLY